MRELLTHLPIVGTCGVIALLAGPLARLPINLGAWLLKWLCRPTRAGDARQAALRDSDNGITRWRTAVRKRSAGRSKNVAPGPLRLLLARPGVDGRLRRAGGRATAPASSVSQPVALPARLDDRTPMSQAVEGRPRQPLAPQHLLPLLERQVRRHDHARPLVRPADHVEEQLRTTLLASTYPSSSSTSRSSFASCDFSRVSCRSSRASRSWVASSVTR